jgi:hypothetical protein
LRSRRFSVMNHDGNRTMSPLPTHLIVDLKTLPRLANRVSRRIPRAPVAGE